MELSEKLQELRKRKGLTQEELAEVLYVSRAAVSKWESGRGCPNIDSLKAIATFFDTTVDELLSGEELLAIAETDSLQKEKRSRALVFGLLDCSAVMLIGMPFFRQENDAIEAVSLLFLSETAPYLRILYFGVIIGMVVSGILTLAFQEGRNGFWQRVKGKLSLGLNTGGALLFIVSLQPYAAALLFVFLLIKVLMLIKRR